MPRFSYQSKHSKEIIKSVNAKDKTEALDFFAKIKVLQTEQFLNIYEVIEG